MVLQRKEFFTRKDTALSFSVLIFQTSITISIVTTMTLAYYGNHEAISYAKILLLLDCLFIIGHLAYRYALARTKIKETRLPLSFFQKRILILHSATSLLVPPCTYVLLTTSIFRLFLFCTVAFLWIISCISGIVFFRKKYFE